MEDAGNGGSIWVFILTYIQVTFMHTINAKCICSGAQTWVHVSLFKLSECLANSCQLEPEKAFSSAYIKDKVRNYVSRWGRRGDIVNKIRKISMQIWKLSYFSIIRSMLCSPRNNHKKQLQTIPFPSPNLIVYFI